MQFEFEFVKRLNDKTDFVMTNILEAGLMRPCDAADFIGVAQDSFHQTHSKKLMEYRYKGRKYYSFLEVFEHSLKNDLNFNKKDIAEVIKNRKIKHVRRLDEIKHLLK